MTTEVQYSQYVDDDLNIPNIPNDLIGKIIDFIDSIAVKTINKLNKILKQLSNHDWWYIIYNDCLEYNHSNFPYNKNIDYSNYKFKGRGKRINSICSIVKNMPLLYEHDNRKGYKNGLDKSEKHNIENILRSGFTRSFRGSYKYMYMCKIKLENKQHYVSKYLRYARKSYVNRYTTILAFMISDFQRDSPDTFTFKCKQVRLTKQIVCQNIDLFIQYKKVDDKTIFTSSFVLEKK